MGRRELPAWPLERSLAWFETVPDDMARVSVLTLGEIRKGARLLDPGLRRYQVELWLDGLIRSSGDRVLPMDQEVALRWGDVGALCQRAGRPQPPVDEMPAATALHHGLTLATRNVANFAGTGVTLVNPWDFDAR